MGVTHAQLQAYAILSEEAKAAIIATLKKREKEIEEAHERAALSVLQYRGEKMKVGDIVTFSVENGRVVYPSTSIRSQLWTLYSVEGVDDEKLTFLSRKLDFFTGIVDPNSCLINAAQAGCVSLLSEDVEAILANNRRIQKENTMVTLSTEESAKSNEVLIQYSCLVSALTAKVIELEAKLAVVQTTNL